MHSLTTGALPRGFGCGVRAAFYKQEGIRFRVSVGVIILYINPDDIPVLFERNALYSRGDDLALVFPFVFIFIKLLQSQRIRIILLFGDILLYNNSPIAEGEDAFVFINHRSGLAAAIKFIKKIFHKRFHHFL